ncbi:MAG: hypothetical protein AB2A00_25955 [Myxococcota bacterium]
MLPHEPRRRASLAVISLSLLVLLGNAAAPDAPLARLVSTEDLALVKNGETVVRRKSAGGRVETMVAAKIDAPPSWVYAQIRDACHLDNSTAYSGAPRYFAATEAESAVAAARGEMERAEVEKLRAITCTEAVAAPTAFSFTTWDLPFPLSDGWSFTRITRTPAGSSGGIIRTMQVAGTLSHLEYHTDVVPLDGGTLLVALSVFEIPFSVPTFMLSSTDQSSKHVVTIRDRAKAAPWKSSAAADQPRSDAGK